jgi:hypothetical protein
MFRSLMQAQYPARVERSFGQVKAMRLSPAQKGAIRFQLHGNGWHWAKGHVARLELAGSDADYYRASNTAFTVKVSDLKAVLRVR